jgi:DNA-binding response OmpR family regulator
MKPLAGAALGTGAAPLVLVVDDDRRVLDLLQIALGAHGFRVLTAGDGDEALRRAIAERPDLVVLDVRLPRKSGLEVCEALRSDPEDPTVPIIMVSAAAETDARLQGLARGADDYLTKPFSPKELIARIKRLLARANEAREARERGRMAEVELTRAREDAQRSHQELRREQRLRELGLGFARELHRTLDPDALARRFLIYAQGHMGTDVTALLWREEGREPLRPAAVHGDGFERIVGLEVRGDGELATLLVGLGRPVRREELERLPELRGEIGPFVARGFTWLAPLIGPAGLEALLLTEERADARDLERLEMDALGTLCGIAGDALFNARRCRHQADALVDALVARARSGEAPAVGAARDEARAIAERTALELELPPRERAIVRGGVALGPWAQTPEGREALAIASEREATGLLGEIAALCTAGVPLVVSAGEDPDRRRAGVLLAAATRYVEARGHGADADQACAEAVAAAAADETVAGALSRVTAESRSPAS